jgi:hypothetical protein
MVDVGGYYKFRDPGFQLLYCYGHTVFGQRENYAYLGLYWTWGNKSGTNVTMNNLIRQKNSWVDSASGSLPGE